MSLKTNLNRRETLQVVLDQPRLFIEESLGSVMVRGEVIVNFAKDTRIQGLIDIVFEGVQKFYPWKEIMKDSSVGSSIETKLQVIELSLIPPNTNGYMPAGVQRFPFEFPIPTSLPNSVNIPNRLEIFYQLRATLRRSFSNQDSSRQHTSNFAYPSTWTDWGFPTNFKKKYTACSRIRIVCAMGSIISDTLLVNNIDADQSQLESNDQVQSQTSYENSSTNQLLMPWNRRHLDDYSGSFDQQHDRLAFSLAGRASTNFHRSVHDLQEVQGVRYKIGFDRTAVAIGTSIGIELMIEPTMADAVVKSAVVKITESRKYFMKVPAGHTRKTTAPETKDYSENFKIVLKWACGYQTNEEAMKRESKPSGLAKNAQDYVYRRIENSKSLFYFDPPQPGGSKSFLREAYSNGENPPTALKNELDEPTFSSTSPDTFSRSDLIDLKQLNQPVKLGEYFGGRFVLPVPDCSNILKPSMEHESIKITHWMHMIVTIECNGKEFDLNLEAPSRILDCRLVAVDDEDQTVLPPPPSYVPGDNYSYHENNWSVSTFWEQREPITAASEWGSCFPCPCEYRKTKANSQSDSKAIQTRVSNDRKTTESISSSTLAACPPSLLPEWGPPPCYSDN